MTYLKVDVRGNETHVPLVVENANNGVHLARSIVHKRAKNSGMRSALQSDDQCALSILVNCLGHDLSFQYVV